VPVILAEFLEIVGYLAIMTECRLHGCSLTASRRFRVSHSGDNQDSPLHSGVFEHVHTKGCRCKFHGALLVVYCNDMLQLYRNQAAFRDFEGDPVHLAPRSIMYWM
jgi:hypothetical protein